MVCFGIPPCRLRSPADIRQALYILRHQIGVSDCLIYIRARITYLWYRTQLYSSHCRSCNCWPRGAGIFSGAMLIISKTVPLRQRPTYTSLIGAMFGIASVIAPLIGGVLTDKATWRWCFYLNLPIGGVTVFFIVFFYQSPGGTAKPKSGWRAQLDQFDVFGTLLFVPSIVCLLLALQFGGSKYHWTNARVVVLFVLFGVLFVGFILVQFWKGEDATVPPRIFKIRNVWGSVVFNITLGASFFVVVYFVSIFPALV